MGFINIGEASQLLSYSENPAPHARIYIYKAGTDSLSPVFKDSDLTFMQTNPVVADATGEVDGIYLADGDYRIVIRNSSGKKILDEDEIPVLSTRQTEVARSFRRVSEMLEDWTLCYAAGIGRQKVHENEIVHVYQDNFSYRVLPATETTPHLTTAGGIKLAVVAGSATVSPAQFGADLTGERESGPALQAMLD